MTNIIPDESADFEVAGSIGTWAAWFGSASFAVSQSDSAANTGTGSMLVDVTSPGTAALNSGFTTWPAAPGDYAVSATLLGPPGTVWNVHVRWQDDSGSDLSTDDFTLEGDGSSFVTNGKTSTAPTGTQNLRLEASDAGSGADVGSYFFDTFVADDQPGGGSTPVAVNPSSAAATATAPIPTVTGAQSIPVTVNAVSAPSTAAAATPAIEAAAAVLAAAAAATAVMATPTVTAGSALPVLVSPPAATAIAVAPALTVTAGTAIPATVAAAAAQATAAGAAPDISAGAAVAVAAAAASSAATPPAVFAGARLNLASADLEGTATARQLTGVATARQLTGSTTT